MTRYRFFSALDSGLIRICDQVASTGPDMKRLAWTDFAATRSAQPTLFEPAEQPKRRLPGTVRRPELRESAIQSMIIDALRLHPLVKRADRVNVGAGRFARSDGSAGRFVRYGLRGQSDIDGRMKDGRQIAIEVKRPSNRNGATQAQLDYIAEVREGGGLAGVAWSVETALAIIEGKS